MASVVSSRQPRRGRGRTAPPQDHDEQGLEDVLVKLFRCATVVKGGRRFSFGAVVVVGDRGGKVGYGYGKANEVPPAVEKAIKQAKRHLLDVPLRGTTIPHRVIGRYGASRIVLVPASEGTGVIAGAAARSVLELAGVKDVLTKSYGSTAAKNLVKATIDGLKQLRTRVQIERLRGVTLDLPPEPEPEPKPIEAYVDDRADKDFRPPDHPPSDGESQPNGSDSDQQVTKDESHDA
jgi:small subunit ribosomal protein S5